MTQASVAQDIRNLTSASDADLLGAWLDRDPQAEACFQALIQRYGRMVQGTCRRHQAASPEDAAQEVFLTLAQKGATLRDHPCLAGWLHSTARFVAHRQREAEGSRRQREALVAPPTASTSTDDRLRDEIDLALDTLEPQFRDPLVLHYLQGQSQQEAAATLGIALGTFSKLLHRSRERFADCLRRRGLALSVVFALWALDAKVIAGEIVPAIAVPAALALTGTTVASAGTMSTASATTAATGMSIGTIVVGSVFAAFALGTVLWVGVLRPDPAVPSTVPTATAAVVGEPPTQVQPAPAHIPEPAPAPPGEAGPADWPQPVRQAIYRALGDTGMLESSEIDAANGALSYSIVMRQDADRFEIEFDAQGRQLDREQKDGR